MINPKSIIIPELINSFSTQAIGAEIGVYKGEMSVILLQKCDIQTLYLIDPYIGGYTNYTESPDSPQHKMDARFQQVSSYISTNFPDKTTFLRKKSEDCTNDVPNNLDFIFIDGDHSYDAVTKDLELWVPKIRPGGIVIGDDWNRRFPEIILAIIHFCEKHSYFQHYSIQHPQYNSLSFKPIPAPTEAPVVNKNYSIWWGITKV